MKKCWIAVASKNHVKVGIKDGFAQACHGKAQPLKRMKTGDGIVYYSPKIEFESNQPCQEFTAIGEIKDDKVYQFDMGGGFTPFRRNVEYKKSAKSVPIKSLLHKLSFIEDKKRWGYKFRFGLFEIPTSDYDLIGKSMLDDSAPPSAQSAPLTRK